MSTIANTRIGAHIVRQLRSGQWAVCWPCENSVLARHDTHEAAVFDANSRRTSSPAANMVNIRRPEYAPTTAELVSFCADAVFRISNGCSHAICLGRCATPKILLSRIVGAEQLTSGRLQIHCSDGKWLFPNGRASDVMVGNCTSDNIAAIFSEAVLWMQHCNKLGKLADFVAEQPAKTKPQLSIVRS